MPYFVKSFWYILHFFSMYSRIVLSILMMEMMSEPKAMVPRWNTVALYIAVPRAQPGRSFFLSRVQYH